MGTTVANFLYGLGRFLQLVGLIMLPLAIAGNIRPNDPFSLGQSLGMTAAGLLVFGLGYYLQQLGKPSN